MQQLRLKRLISSLLPLVLLVTLMQAIPVVFPKLDLSKAVAAGPSISLSTFGSCALDAGLSNVSSPAGACDGSTDSKFIGFTGTSNIRINLDRLAIVTDLSFSGGDDDVSYPNRRVASYTLKGCTASSTASSACTTLNSDSWSSSELSAIANGGSYPTKTFSNTTAYQYYYLETTPSGQADAPCASTPYFATTCVQFSEILIFGKTAPGAPTLGTVTASTDGSRQVVLGTWTAPSAGGGTLSNYRVEFTADAGANWIVATSTQLASTRTFTATNAANGIVNGGSYKFRISARNEVGWGLLSAESDAVVPYGSPLTPTFVSSVAGNLFTDVSINQTFNGRAISNYQFSNDGTGYTTLNPAQSTSPIRLSGVNSCSTQTRYLKAVDDLGRASSALTLSNLYIGCYLVTFNTNGGGSPIAQRQNSVGGPITTAAPSKSNYAFVGWYENSNLTGTRIAWNSSYTPTTNQTLFAAWSGESNVSSGPSSFNSTATVNYSITKVGAGLTGNAKIELYYSSNSNLSSASLCGTVSNPATTGSISCPIPSASGTYWLYTIFTDSDGNIELAPGTADRGTTSDTVAPKIQNSTASGSSGAATSAATFIENIATTDAYNTLYSSENPTTWSLTGPDASRFVLTSTVSGSSACSTSTCYIKLASSPDFENPTDADGNNTYVADIVVTDTAGNTTSQTYTVTISNAPEVTSPSISSISTTSATLNFNADSSGTYYYLVYAAAAAAPTAGNVFSQGPAIAKGSGSASTNNSVSISGLSNSTQYIAYVIVRSGSVNSSVSSVAFTTATPSNDATLSGLTISSGTLSPTFSSSTTSYSATVTNATTSITLTPTRNQGNATIGVRLGTSGSYTPVTSGSASGSLSLNVGTNTIEVLVTAQDGTTTKLYTLTISRLPVVPTITKFDVQVKSGNSALVPDKTLTSLLSANYSPTYARYQDVAFTVNATTTDAGVLTWQIREGTNCSSSSSAKSGSTDLAINTTKTISTWNTSTCYIVEVINTLSGVTSSVLSTYQFLPQYTTTPVTVNATTTANNLNGVFGASFSNSTPFSISGGGGSWQYYMTGAPAGLSIDVSTGVITGTFTTVSTGSGAYIRAVDANGGTAYALVGPITWAVTAGAALVPTFGTPTETADGFTVTITNFDSAYTWATPTVGSGSVAVTSTTGSNRLLTVTGLSPGTTVTITQGTSRTGYTSGSATVSGTSTAVASPTLTSFASSNVNTPSSAVFGSTVTITGTNFSNATAVKQGTTSASSFTVVNSTTITFTVNAASGSTYAISVTTAGGTATSSTNLTVTPEVPSISTQPSSATRSVGTSVTFTVVIGSLSETGTVLSYQWKKGSNNISGATSSSYTISSPAVADAGDYSVTISNTSSNTTAVAFLASNAATLTMNTANTTTSFTASSTTPTFGTAVTLTATATTGATGTVTFKDASNNTLCTTGNLSSGSANCSWTPSSTGDFVVSAVYEGDVNYSTSTSSTATVTVGKANQSTLTISSLGTSSKSYPYSQALNATTSGGSGNGNVTYAIESGGSATSCTLSSNSATATLTATAAGTCLIKATKSGGTNYNDATSATSTFTFSDVAPGAPTITAITAGFGSLSIAFTAGTNSGTALTNYAYSTDGGASFKNLATPGTTSPIVITTVSASSSSLVAGTTYSVKIRAINTVNGTDSGAVNGTPRTATVPGAATGVLTTSSATSLNATINWSAESNGSPITKWWLSYGYTAPGSATVWGFSIVDAASDGTYQQSYTMLPGLDYEFTAEAENSIGRHPYFFGPSVYGAPLSVTYNGQSNTSGSVPVNSTIYLRNGSVVVSGNTGTLARTGYTWGGWTVNSNGIGTVYTGGETYTLGAANLVLYAKWNPNTLTVTYDSKSGTSVSAGSVLTGGSLSAPTAPTRTGYDFAFWSATDGGSALTFPYSPPNTGNFTLYARWTAKTLAVTYDVQGGSSVTSGSTTTGGGISVSPGTPTRSGYSFNGWFAGATGGSALTFPYAHGLSADFTLYAQWSAVTYTITYAKNGATGDLATASESYTTGGTAITLPGRGTLVKAGHTFAGWSTSGNTPVLSGGYTTTSNVTLSAVWTPISYTITYNANSGDSTPTQASLTIGQTFILANAITRAPSGGISYQFAGWDNGTTIFQAGEVITIGTANLSYTAVWVQLYEVTYVNNGGSFTGSDSQYDTECTSNLCTNNQAITLNAAPTRAGYEFAGWEDQSGVAVTDTNTGTTGIQTTVTSTRFIFSANWTAVSYTVTYASSGSTAPTQASLTIGQSFVVASAVTRTGYSFNGYSDGTRTYLPGATYVVGSSNVTLTALWIADVYTVSYDWNGSTGTATSASTYTVGTSSDISLPVVGNQAKTNYSFDGWSLTRNGTKLSGSTYVPTSSVTLYARWVIDVYTVTYSVQGGTGIASTATTDAGGSVTLPLPTRNHYVFQGWYDSNTGGSLVSLANVSYTPSASVTLYARWRQSSLTGFTDAQLTRVLETAKSSSTQDRTFTFNTTGGYGVSVFVPKEALPNNTELGFYLAASPSATAKSRISGTINYVLSVVIAWVDPTGDVPDTSSGSPIRVTITDTSIKAGAIVYSQIAGQVVELGRATQNGSVTVNITSDPEIFVVQSKPSAPSGVSATDSSGGVSTITWNAPSDMGGSELIFYSVTSSGVEVCRTAQTSCSASGLTDTTRYSFIVTATNGVGTSDASTASNLINPPVTTPPVTTPPVTTPTTPAPEPTPVPVVIAPAFETPNFARSVVFADTKFELPGKTTTGSTLKWRSTSAACSVSVAGMITWNSTGLCSLIAAVGAAEISYAIQVDPRTEVSVQEITQVQSSNLTVNATVKWPGQAFDLRFCVGKSTNKCLFNKVISINSLEGQTLTADGDLYITTTIAGLSPRSEYDVFATVIATNKSLTSNVRSVKTPAGIAASISGATTITVGQEYGVTIDVSGEGSVTSLRAVGLPAGVSIARTATGGTITGKPRATGVYFVTVKLTDSFRQITDLPVTLVVNQVASVAALVDGAIYKPTSATTTLVSWKNIAAIKSIEVRLGATVMCTTTTTSCVVKQLLGPKSTLQILATNPQGAVANPVLPIYVAPKKLVEVGTANFETNSTKLTTAQKNALKKVAADMEAKGFTQLTVYGYSDQTGSKATNDKISLARATAIYSYLKVLLAEKQLTVTLIGKGFKDPVASNATAVGRAANRRAVVSVG
jgi:uncharacterized repeat protein (TIGR02543 family)